MARKSQKKKKTSTPHDPDELVPKSWTTYGQRDWLAARMPEYEEARRTRTTTAFLTSLMLEWYQVYDQSPIGNNEEEEQWNLDVAVRNGVSAQEGIRRKA